MQRDIYLVDRFPDTYRKQVETDGSSLQSPLLTSIRAVTAKSFELTDITHPPEPKIRALIPLHSQRKMGFAFSSDRGKLSRHAKKP